jgi:importin subunit beta-1
LTSLLTIGYICEELSPEDLTQDLKNQIMLALTNNISKEAENVEACRLAIKALLNSIPYTAANF